MKLIVNEEQKDLSVERATKLVSDFCLFDGSYKNYDCRNDPKDLEEALKLAYQIRARSPEKSSKLLGRLKEKVKWEDINELKTKKIHNIENFEKTRKLFGREVIGMGASFKSKIFHRCLPELIPIIDNECILQTYRRKQNTVECIEQIAKDVRQSQKFLEEVQVKLKKKGIKELSILRIFDIIIWAFYKQRSLKKQII